jgi:hypothetical protein
VPDNIVTEKWKIISPMLFDQLDSSLCPFNEYQIVVAGGIGYSSGKLTDIVEIYDVLENTWKLFVIGFSSSQVAK